MRVRWPFILEGRCHGKVHLAASDCNGVRMQIKILHLNELSLQSYKGRMAKNTCLIAAALCFLSVQVRHSWYSMLFSSVLCVQYMYVQYFQVSEQNCHTHAYKCSYTTIVHSGDEAFKLTILPILNGETWRFYMRNQ